MIFMIKEYS